MDLEMIFETLFLYKVKKWESNDPNKARITFSRQVFIR